MNVASEGDTEELAVDNLREALELYFEDTDDDVPPVDQSHVGDLILRTDSAISIAEGRPTRSVATSSRPVKALDQRDQQTLRPVRPTDLTDSG